MWNSHPQRNGTWKAGSGATWSLTSDAMRPAGWTSADAAGLPILPGLVRYEEVAAGHVDHAIRITVPDHPDVLHLAGPPPGRVDRRSTSAPPMGTWLRLKRSVNPTTFPADVRPIIVALQTYGAIVADNGSAWYISGVPDSRWNNDDLHTLGSITGSDFDVVDASSLMVDPNSEQAK